MYSLLITQSEDNGTKYITARVVTLENNKPRNISSSIYYDTPKNQYYANLTLKAHISNDYVDLGLVVHGLSYSDVYTAELSHCEAMFKTLKRITDKIEKIDQTRIYNGPKPFAQSILDFATVIKAEYIVFYKTENIRSRYDDNDYRLYKPSDAHYSLQSLVDKVVEK